MDYIELTCKIESEKSALLREMLIHELLNIGYESFVDVNDGLLAYIANRDFDPNELTLICFSKDLNLGKIYFKWELVKDQNWNEEWERNFSPVLISNCCYIRATFHKPMINAKYDIIIDPKMSFGTGHHETTSLMIERMLNLEFRGKKVLDMGCGTGILSILASKLGAESIAAVDIDEWAFENTRENCVLNNINNIEVIIGNRGAVPKTVYQIVIANINKNILLQDMDIYGKHAAHEGHLLVSGFYLSDLSAIKESAQINGFQFIDHMEKNKWVVALFQKK